MTGQAKGKAGFVRPFSLAGKKIASCERKPFDRA
jgi:hypothetical protein